MKLNVLYSWIFPLLLIAGCSGSATEVDSPLQNTVAQQLPEVPAADPLTHEEMRAFLEVVRQLPGREIPQFREANLPHLTQVQNLAASMSELRLAIRSAIAPGRQADLWAKDQKLRTAFAEMGVNPLAFADLMVRISCAWSAWTVSQETPIRESRMQLELRISELTQQLSESASQTIPSSNVEEQLESLEVLISLSEFLALLEAVPEESLQAVASAQVELRPILPRTELAQEIKAYLQQQSAILRVSR